MKDGVHLDRTCLESKSKFIMFLSGQAVYQAGKACNVVGMDRSVMPPGFFGRFEAGAMESCGLEMLSPYPSSSVGIREDD